jgi:hypothetical protein
MSDQHMSPEQECADLMRRLARFRTIHVARLAGQEAAVELQRRGVVSIEYGSGADQGLLLVRLAFGARLPGDGGAA